MFFSTRSATAQANWTKVPLPSIYYEITPYFLNENVGFVYTAGNTVQTNLRRTTDGGSTWTWIRFFDDGFIRINQIYFTSIQQGYVAGSNGVYETSDNGISWKKIYDSPIPVNSVYAFENKVFAFVGVHYTDVIWGPLIVSANHGDSWDTIISPTVYSPTNLPALPLAPYVFGNKDGTVFAENVVNNNLQLYYSTDNGKNWSSGKMDVPMKTYTMGFFCFPHCNDLVRTFIAVDRDPNSDLYVIGHTSDFGAHWDTLFHPVEIGAWIAGTNCAQYVSDAQGMQFGANRQGLWRSVDHGKNWAYLNGPAFQEIDDEDFHNLCAVGGGAIVYAGDHPRFGAKVSLWKTTTGGDGTLSASQFASQISIQHELSTGAVDTLKLKVCDTGIVTVPFQNISCNVATLQSVAIDSLDPSEFSTTLIHHLYCDGLPDTLLLKISPSSAGKRNITVHPKFINDEYETIDTSFTFTLEATSASGTTMYLKSGAVSGAAADSIDLPLYLNNPSPAPIQLGLDSIELRYSLNTDIIDPIIFIPSLPGIRTGTITTTRSDASFTLYFPSGFSFTGETMIGKLRSKLYVSDTFETDIAFSGNAQTSPCASILSNSIIHFSLAAQCGDPALSQFLKDGNAFFIQRIVPNPAKNTIQVILDKNTSGELRYELFDALGIPRKNGAFSGNSLQIDLADLSDGSYYLRLSGDRGMPVTRSIIIAK